MDCPRCKSTDYIKQGYAGERQRYKCKKCLYVYTVLERGKPFYMKKNALRLYLEGMGFRAIGRFLGVSQVSVMNWIKAFGKQAEETPELVIEAPIIEMDEIHTYVGEKKTMLGFGQPLTDLEKGLLISKLATVEQKRVRNSLNL